MKEFPVNDFDNEEEVILESDVADEVVVDADEAETIETPVPLPSDEAEDEGVVEDGAPLHEGEGSVLGLSDEDAEDEFEDMPDPVEESELPLSDEEWDALPETPELEEQYEPESEDEELRQLDEDSFSTEDLGPVASETTIQHYEVQARTYDEQPWETIAYVDPEEDLLEVADLPVGETWSFRIRTVFTNGESSAWSAPSPVVFPEDMLAPGIPSDPIVVGNHAGIGVTWDGLDEDGHPMPPDFARVIIWQSPTGEDGTFERRASIPGAMEAILTGYDADEEHYFAFTAMDFAGNESGFSGIGSAARTSLVNVKEIEDELARLDQTDADLTEAAEELGHVFDNMAERQDEFDDSIADAVERLGVAETTLAPLPADLAEARQSAENAQQAAEAAEARAAEANSRATSRLANGNFDEGLDFWVANGVTMSDGDGHSGTTSALFTEGGELYPEASLPVVAGQVWELTLYYKGTVGALGVSVWAQGEDGTYLETFDNFTLPASEVWVGSGTLRFTIPEGAYYLQFTVYAQGDGWMVDDVSLRDATDVLRLEAAATESRLKAEEALSKANLVELSIEGPGGLRSQLTQAQADVSEAATSTELAQLDDKLTDAERLIGLDLDKLEADLERAQARLTNLSPEGDFEGTIEDTSGGSGANPERWSLHETPDAYKGSKVLRYVHEDASQSSFRTKPFDVTPGRTYRVRFAVKLASGTGGDGSGGMGNTWYRQDGTSRDTWQDYALWDQEAFTDHLGSDWAVLEGDVVAPDDVVQMRPRFYIFETTLSVGAVLYFDDLSVIDVTELRELEAATAEAATTSYLDRLVVREGVVTPEVVTGKLWADGLRANSAELARAVIAATNPIPHPVEDANTPSLNRFFQPGSDGFGHNQSDPSIWVLGRKTVYTRGTVRLDAGVSYRFNVDVAGTVAGTRYYIDLVRPGWQSGETFTRIASNVLAGTKSNWLAHEAVFTVPESGDYELKFWANHRTGSPAGVENDEGYQWFRGLSIVNMTHGSLVVQNSITAREINVTDRLITDLFGANRALIEEELVVNGGLIANNADLIAASIKSLSVTERADLVDAYARELYAEEFAARVAAISQLTVASSNLIPGMSQILESTPPPFKTGFGRNTGHPSIWVRSGENDHGSIERDTSADSDSLIPLSGGEMYRFRVGVSASVTGSTAYIALLDEDGNRVTITRNGSASSYLLVNQVAGSTATSPNYYEAEFSPPETGRYRLRFYANHTNGEPNPESYQWFHGLEISRKLDGRILLDGTLQSRHIENTGDILTDALTARKIRGVDIDGDTFAGNTFRGGLFEGAVVQGGTVQTHAAPSRGIKLSNNGINGYNSAGSSQFFLSASTGNMTSYGGTISGGTVTGGTVQTIATANRGIKLTSSGLRAYSSSGRQSVFINGSTGDISIDGGTFTGGTFQSHTARNRGTKLSNSGLDVYDSRGNRVVKLSPDSHANILVGDLRTALDDESYIQLRNGSAGPTIRFRRPGGEAFDEPAIFMDEREGNRLTIRGLLPSNQTSAARRVQTRIEGGIGVVGASTFSSSTTVNGEFRAAGFLTTSSSVNTRINSGGLMYRVESARRSKINIEDVPKDLPERLLDLNPRVWIDRAEVQEALEDDYGLYVAKTKEGPKADPKVLEARLGYEPQPVAGLVAEELLEAGLDTYVQFDKPEAGVGPASVAGIDYDRLWTLLIPLVREQRDQIETLESKVDDLETRLAKLEALLPNE